METLIGLGAAAVALGLAVLALFIAVTLRRVVPPNEVHVVQSTKKRTMFGAGQSAGNVYYAIPGFIPVFGVQVSRFEVSNFKVELGNYAAYDINRLPFLADVVAFFHIYDPDMAAQRAPNFGDLVAQLQEILRGSVRRVLANHRLEDILGMRGELGKTFTDEVNEQLKEWGVSTVKMIEFMDMRDAPNSHVIADIMAKDQARINQESRIAIADNERIAKEREIAAQQEIDLKTQAALQVVGQREAQVERDVGIAKEQSQQEVLAQAATTAERDMAVKRVREVKDAEIAREVAKVRAEQDKQVEVVNAEAERQRTEIVAEGQLTAAQREAEGVKAKGLAEAEARKAMELAPVQAQITLAQEIGANEGYQTYLVRVEQVKAAQAVGVEQAKALEAANIKIIANGGSVTGGLDGIGSIFSSGGGLSVGAMLEGLSQTETGKALIDRATGEVKPVDAPPPRPRRGQQAA